MTPTLKADELTVLEHLSYGRRQREIARDMHMAPDTIKSLLARVYRKLGAGNAAHAVAVALREGWLR